MKYKAALIVILVLSSMNACINNEERSDSIDLQLTEISPTSFGVSEMRGDTVILTMEQNCGSACWADLEDRISRDDKVYSITTVAQVTSEICTEQCVEYSREYNIVLPDSGNYEFRYVISDTTTSVAYVYWDGSQ